MLSKNYKITREEKEIIRQFDSRLFGYIKPKNENYSFYIKIILRGIEHFESLLFWKKNLFLLQYDSNFELHNEVNVISEAQIFIALGHLNLLIEQYPQALSAYQHYYSLENEYWKNTLFLYGIGLVYFHFGAFNLASDAFYQTLYVDPNFSRSNEIHLRLGVIHKIRGDFKYTLKHFQLTLIDESSPLSISKAQIYFYIAHLFECFGYLTLARQIYEFILNAPPATTDNNPNSSPQPLQVRPEIDEEIESLFSLKTPGRPPAYVEVDPYVKASALRQIGWLVHNFSRVFNKGAKLFHQEDQVNKISCADDSFVEESPLTLKDQPTAVAADVNIISCKDREDRLIKSLSPYLGIHHTPTQSVNTSQQQQLIPSPNRCSSSATEFNEGTAIRFLQSAISLDPTSGQTWYYLGRCFAHLGKIHDAFISYRHSIDKSEGSADTWCSIGVLYQQQNQPMDALQAYICAIQLNKKFTPAWTNLALLYETCNMPKDALTCYANAIKAGDPNPALLPRIKKLKDNVLNGNIQNFYLKGKTPLPTIEEAWNLPIPAELTSRQNADSKIPPFMAKYIYPLLQQQRDMRLKLGNLYPHQNGNLTNSFNGICKNSRAALNSSTSPATNIEKTTQSPVKRSKIDSQQQTAANGFDGFSVVESETANEFLLGDEDEDEEDETLIDPAMERELESLLALDGADPNILIDACMMGGTSGNILTGPTPPIPIPSSTPIIFTGDNEKRFNATTTTTYPSLHNTNPTTNQQQYSQSPYTAYNNNNNPTVPSLLGDFSTPSFLYDSVDPSRMRLANSAPPFPSANNYTAALLAAFDCGNVNFRQFDGETLLAPINLSSAEIINDARSETFADFEKALANVSYPPPRPPPHPNPPDPLTFTGVSELSTSGGPPGGFISNPSSIIPEEQIPIITITGKKQAHSQDLKNFCLNKPVSLIRGLCQCLKLDLGLFSTKTLVRTHPDHTIEVRAQARFPLHKNYSDTKSGRKTSWKCISTRHYMPLLKYAKYQGTSFKRALEEEKSKGSTVETEENEAKAIKDCPPFKKILFGTNVDLSDEVKWVEQLQELSKLPTFLKVSSPTNMLSHIGHTVLGMNSVQLYMKVPGCRTPGHRENLNFCSVNINIGPGDTEWYAVRDEYWGALADLCSARGCDFLKGSWWPGDIEELHKYQIPFTKFTQKPGDIVWVNSGTVHWVQASGWCNNIAWNVGPLNAYQYESALLHYEWNKLQQYKSLVPMVHLSWNLARNVKINNDNHLLQLIMSTLYKSLKRVHVLEEILKTAFSAVPLHFHGVATDEPAAHYCDKCEIEVFNLLFVLDASIVHCFECARRMSPTLNAFVVLKQYETRDLDTIYDNLRKTMPLKLLESVCCSTEKTAHPNSSSASSTSIFNINPFCSINKNIFTTYNQNSFLDNNYPSVVQSQISPGLLNTYTTTSSHGDTKSNYNVKDFKVVSTTTTTQNSQHHSTKQKTHSSNSSSSRKRSSNNKSSTSSTNNFSTANNKTAITLSNTTVKSVMDIVPSTEYSSSFNHFVDPAIISSSFQQQQQQQFSPMDCKIKLENFKSTVQSSTKPFESFSSLNTSPVSSIPSHKLMRTPSGQWIKKDNC